MNEPTIPQMLENIVVNAKEIVVSRDATEDIADAAAAIMDDAKAILALIPTQQEYDGSKTISEGTGGISK